jgi:hypothetical protein
MIKSACTNTAQLIPRRKFLAPHVRDASCPTSQCTAPRASRLPAALRAVLDRGLALRAQPCVSSGAERAAPQRHLIDAALSSASSTTAGTKAADVRRAARECPIRFRSTSLGTNTRSPRSSCTRASTPTRAVRRRDQAPQVAWRTGCGVPSGGSGEAGARAGGRRKGSR